jgi:hypothetical protein
MSLENIYIALIAKKAENIILKTGFKNVLALANVLSKGVKRSKKSLVFKACYCYIALKNLDMNYQSSNPINNSKWIEVKESKIASVINKGVFYTVFDIVTGLRFIPKNKRYLVMRYSENELFELSQKYNFSILLVG